MQDLSCTNIKLKSLKKKTQKNKKQTENLGRIYNNYRLYLLFCIIQKFFTQKL